MDFLRPIRYWFSWADIWSRYCFCFLNWHHKNDTMMITNVTKIDIIQNLAKKKGWCDLCKKRKYRRYIGRSLVETPDTVHLTRPEHLPHSHPPPLSSLVTQTHQLTPGYPLKRRGYIGSWEVRGINRFIKSNVSALKLVMLVFDLIKVSGLTKTQPSQSCRYMEDPFVVTSMPTWA